MRIFVVLLFLTLGLPVFSQPLVPQKAQILWGDYSLCDLQKNPSLPWEEITLPLEVKKLPDRNFWLRGQLEIPENSQTEDLIWNLGRWDFPLEVWIGGQLVYKDGSFHQDLPFSQGLYDRVPLSLGMKSAEVYIRTGYTLHPVVEQSWTLISEEENRWLTVIDFFNIHVYGILSLLVFFIASFFLLLFSFDPKKITNLWFALANLFFGLYFMLAWKQPGIFPALPSFILGKASLFPALGCLLLFFTEYYTIGKRKSFQIPVMIMTVLPFGALLIFGQSYRLVNDLFMVALVPGQIMLFGQIGISYLAYRRGYKDAVVILAGAALGVGLGTFDVVHILNDQRPWIWLQGIGIFLFNSSMFISLAVKYMRSVKILETSNNPIRKKNLALKELNQVKDQFLANTSHELRTPLVGMTGILEVVLAHPETLTPENFRQLSLVYHSAARLGRLINDILDLSLLNRKELKMHLGPVDLTALGKRVIALFEPLAGEKVLEFRAPEAPLTVRADGARLEQVLVNLVGNAVKFTRRGWIRLSLLPQDDGVMVQVSDSGIGIPREHQQGIFDSFKQGDPGINREFGGTGLGLTISRDLLRLMNSELQLSSTPGKGTTFFFTLEELSPGGGTTGPMSGPPAPGTPLDLKVLVVDDEPVNLEVIKAQLRGTGTQIQVTLSGAEALGLADREPYDLILLDVMLPGMSGFEVARTLRKKGVDTPLLFLTARNTPTDVLEALKSGGGDLLLKPTGRSELINRLKLLDALFRNRDFEGSMVDPGTLILVDPQEGETGDPEDLLGAKVSLESRGGKILAVVGSRWVGWIPPVSQNHDGLKTFQAKGRRLRQILLETPTAWEQAVEELWEREPTKFPD